MGLLNSLDPEERIRQTYEMADEMRNQIIDEWQNEHLGKCLTESDWNRAVELLNKHKTYDYLSKFYDKYCDDLNKLVVERNMWKIFGDTVSQFKPTVSQLSHITQYIQNICTQEDKDSE